MFRNYEADKYASILASSIGGQLPRNEGDTRPCLTQCNANAKQSSTAIGPSETINVRNRLLKTLLGFKESHNISKLGINLLIRISRASNASQCSTPFLVFPSRQIPA